MKRTIYIWLAALALTLAACSGDNDSPGKETNTVHEDDDNTTATVDDSYTYTLPVIFHVIYKDASDQNQYIPQSRLKEILDNVNDLYAGSLYASQWDDTSERINVRFKLAEYDEKGNKLSTPGVEYVKWSGTYPIDPYDFMSEHKEYVRYIWEPNDYVNVMMYNFADEEDADGETLGISHMPYGIEGYSVDGLTMLSKDRMSITKSNLSFAYCSSINSKYAWKNSDGNYYQSDRYTASDHQMFHSSLSTEMIAKDINVTLAHELGHYLGLHHAFTERDVDGGYEITDSCGNTDFCLDTPDYNRVRYVDDITRYMGRLQRGESLRLDSVIYHRDCGGSEFRAANIMDYYFNLGYKFTANQKARIRNVLYYSPLIPGPKKGRSENTRAARHIEGIVNLPIRIVR